MEALTGGQQAMGEEVLNLCIELYEAETLKLLIKSSETDVMDRRLLSGQLVEVMGCILQIAETHSLEEGTRHLAIEFMITLVEALAEAGMMDVLPQPVSRLFAILMQLLSDSEDEPAWYTAEFEDEHFSFGQECLDRLALAIAFGSNTISSVLFEQLTSYSASPDWQKRLAALIALAKISKRCSKEMIKKLEELVNLVLNSLRDPHACVRWAAVNAIGQLSMYLGPYLQKGHYQRVLPELATAMHYFQDPRAQAHTSSAVLKFMKNCSPDILKPYLNQAVGELLRLLWNDNRVVQEGAWTALASVPSQIQRSIIFPSWRHGVVGRLWRKWEGWASRKWGLAFRKRRTFRRPSMRRVLVDNLPYLVKLTHVTKYFRRFGAVRRSRFLYDKETLQSSRRVLIEMAGPVCASNAIKHGRLPDFHGVDCSKVHFQMFRGWTRDHAHLFGRGNKLCISHFIVGNDRGKKVEVLDAMEQLFGNRNHGQISDMMLYCKPSSSGPSRPWYMMVDFTTPLRQALALSMGKILLLEEERHVIPFE